MNKNERPAISVCMPVYNGKKFLAQAFECLAKQTRKDFEVVMVDDGSRDGSFEFAQHLIEHHNLKGRVLRQHNRGCEQARDLACANAVGHIFAPYDCDDTWAPTYLEEMSGVLDRHPDVGLVYCDFDEDFVGEGKLVRKSRISPWIEVKRAKEADPGVHVYPNGVFFEMLLQGQVLFPPCTMMRRSVYDAVSGYCAKHPLQRISLDWCFGLRSSRVTSVAYIDKPLLEKSRHGGNVSGNQAKTAAADVSVLDAILADGTLTLSQRMLARARAAMRCADAAYEEWAVNGNARIAQKWLLRSLQFRASPRALVMLIKTLVPSFVIATARQLRARAPA